MKPSRIYSTVVLLVLPLLSAGAGSAQDDVVMRAMRDELARSMADLRLEELSRPYFIAYRVDELNEVSAAASFGSVTSSRENLTRRLSVEVRVGDYAFDNTNFLGPPSFPRLRSAAPSAAVHHWRSTTTTTRSGDRSG